jgi:putative endonuclease
MKKFNTYIITNKETSALFVGSTGNLPQRIHKHKNKTYKNSYTEKHNLDKLVYFEGFDTMKEANTREAQVKSWSKNKTKKLINKLNPELNDLYEDIK